MKITSFPALWLLLLWLVCASNSVAESVVPMPDNNQAATTTLAISKESVQAKINALTERKGLDESLKSKVLASYQNALEELNNIASFNERAQAFKNAIKQAPELSKKLQRDTEQASEKPHKPDIAEFMHIPIEELTQRQVIEQDKVNRLDARIKKLESDLTEQNNRPSLIRQETLKAKQELDNLRKSKTTATSVSESKLEIDAQQLYLQVANEARTAELALLDTETVSYAARLALLKEQLNLLDLQKKALMPTLSTIEEALTLLQQQEDKDRQDALSQVEKELADKPAIIQEVARENLHYSQNLQDINKKIDRYEAEKAKTDTQISEIDRNRESATKKVDLATLSPPLGKLLHEQRRNLLNQDQFILRSELLQSEIATANLEQLVIDEKLRQLRDVDAYLQQKMADSANKKDSMQQRMMTQAELRVLLNLQIELLSKLSVSYNNYLRALGDFDFSRQQRHDKTEKFALYLDEHLLWVRSSEALNSDIGVQLYQSSIWLLSPNNWQMLVNNFLRIPIKQPVSCAFALLAFALLLRLKKRMLARLGFIAANINKPYDDRFHYTLEALLYKALQVLPLPLLASYIGWFLSGNLTNDNFSQAIGTGLKYAAISWLLLDFLYQLFKPNGIVQQHFYWQNRMTALVRAQLAWLRFVFTACTFLIKSTLVANSSVYSDSLGRLALNLSILALVICLTRLLHPNRGVLQEITTKYPDGWLANLRYIFYLAAFSPLIIIGFSVFGYYLSALELQQKLKTTLLLVISVGLIYELIAHWLVLANRQLALKNLQNRRKLVALEAVTGSEEQKNNSEQLDIPTINAQTFTLLNVAFYFGLIIGLWLVWQNIFPAFSFLEHIELWQNKVLENNKEVYHSITLINLLLVGVYAFVSIVAVRNFSGVMELLVFRRVAVEAGSRYAINQLAKYTLIIIGFFSITNELGFSWSQVQWLVAALSVGLGFGLQEIFANFVSGIILLFERPIRVGDIVTIADVSGKVSRIHMRATTLIDFDQKELIVPNKTFITTQLVNWSLSDSITRVVIAAAAPYDCDVELAHKLLLEAVHASPLVLKDPEPSVFLVSFAENWLEYSIRVFVAETINRMPATHDIHTRIVKIFREHGIEIPVPQRDVHIRSVIPEWQSNKRS